MNFTEQNLSAALNIAGKYTNTLQDAEDVVQLACVRAVVKYHQCKSNFDAWFRMIVRNTALNFHRYPKPNVSLTPELEQVLVYDVETCGIGGSGDFEALDCSDIVENLTDREQDIILGKFVNNTSQLELAEKYGVTAPTIRSWRNNALDKLRKQFVTKE